MKIKAMMSCSIQRPIRATSFSPGGRVFAENGQLGPAVKCSFNFKMDVSENEIGSPELKRKVIGLFFEEEVKRGPTHAVYKNPEFLGVQFL